MRDIDTLIKPVIERQQKINFFVLMKLAKRIKKIGTLLPSDLHTVKVISETTMDIKQINQYLAKMADLQVNAIQEIIKNVAYDAYDGMEAYYNMSSIPFVSLEHNEPVKQSMLAIARNTGNSYRNLANAQAFMVRDLTNPTKLIDTPMSKIYQSVVDEAIQAVQSNVMDYQTAMRRTVKQLVESDVKVVEYEAESGKKHVQDMEAAVRRDVLDGVRQVSQQVQDITGEQFGSTGKEISVHRFSAPDHEPIQGHQFTNEEWEKLQNNEPFQDLNGKHFEKLKRRIGVWNCHHLAYPIMAGITKPNYTQEELDKIIEDNHKGYTTSTGKTYTMYECTQMQRAMERKIRKAKQGQMIAVESGDEQLAQEYQAKISKYVKEYDAFSKACGLSVKGDRIRVDGYKPIKLKKK